MSIKNESIESNILERVKWFGLRKLYWDLRDAKDWIIDFVIDNGPFSSDFQQTLIKRNISHRLFNDYFGEGHNTDEKQMFIGFALIQYAFVRNVKPKRILIVGSQQGYIPATLALACKDNNMGHIDFVDAGYDRDDLSHHWGGIGLWKRIDVKKHFARIKVDSFISTYVMTTKEFAQKFPHRKYQYIYIDGDHSYQGVKLDYRLFWPKLEKNCFMLFHDVVAHGYFDEGLYGVHKFWRELKNKNKIVFPFPLASGLGCVQKI